MSELNAHELRQALAHFPSGVVAICALMQGQPCGVVASSFTSVSLNPPLVSVCMRNESATWRDLSRAQRLGISVLGANHDGACRQIAGKSDSRFLGIDWVGTDAGAVFIEGASVKLECAIDSVIPAGDHQIVLLRIQSLQVEQGVHPLVFHGSSFTRLAAPA